MYERFYRLRERPFALTPDPDYLYPSRVHQEALNYLRYGIESHAGFIVITGAIGSGKTTLLQTLLRGLDSRTTVARLMNTLLDPRELVESAMIDFGLDPAGASKPAMLKKLGEFLVSERSAGRLVLLVIDEAQNLSLPALEEIRMLSNLETEKSKLLQIVLIGQPDLRDKLDRPELEQLRQRITVSYHLEPLDADETARYVNHRLARAAIGAPLEFPEGATDRIHARSGGVPRLINVIADAALVFGYGEERSVIDESLIDEVITDLDATGVLGPRSNPNRHASVVPPEPVAEQVRLKADTTSVSAAAAIAAGPVVATGSAVVSGFSRTDDDAIKRELAAVAARESALKQREHEIAAREREIAEQKRVLAEQYRLLNAQAGAQASAPSWPPAYVRSATLQPRESRRRAGFWRRMRNTILGTAEPVLEDSL
jgi:putative secretion ATPase (PEP-CTERM system associated)